VERERAVEADVGYVQFLRTGDGANGEFHCSGCGYGVTIWRTLPRCPMCGGQTWEQSASSLFRAPLETRAEL
jgi:rubrerythrin